MATTLNEAHDIAQEVVSRLNLRTDILYDDNGEQDDEIDNIVHRFIVEVLMERNNKA